MRDNLFLGEYIFLHSGDPTDFKIDASVLTDGDIKELAKLVGQRVKFGQVYGIPSGGERLAAALESYRDKGNPVTLIVDDVLTTGSSFRATRDTLMRGAGEESQYGWTTNELTRGSQYNYVGVCIFCRRPRNKPGWVKAIFTMEDFSV